MIKRLFQRIDSPMDTIIDSPPSINDNKHRSKISSSQVEIKKETG